MNVIENKAFQSTKKTLMQINLVSFMLLSASAYAGIGFMDDPEAIAMCDKDGNGRINQKADWDGTESGKKVIRQENGCLSKVIDLKGKERIAQGKERIAQLDTDIAQLDTDIAQLDTDIAQSKERIAQGKERIEKRRQDMLKRLTK